MATEIRHKAGPVLKAIVICVLTAGLFAPISGASSPESTKHVLVIFPQDGLAIPAFRMVFDGTKEVFGVPAESKLSYRAFLQMVHPDDREYVDTIWQAALKGAPSDIEHRVIVDDKSKWVRAKVEVEFDRRSGSPLQGTSF